MRQHTTLLALLLALGSSPVMADVLEMPMPYDEPTTPYETVTPEQMFNRPRVELSLPVRGMTMNQVEKSFGRPIEVVPAVGKPPITRWVYDQFTVYFEYLHVIYSVEKRRPRPAAPMAPATLPSDEQSVAPGLYD